MTRVSVLLPVRNGRTYLHQAIASILSQTHINLELIVIDDGSSDGSGEIARAFVDPRVSLIRTDGVGIAAALNLGIASAHGDFIARQDADDLSAPTRIELQASYLENHPDIALVSSRVSFIDDEGDAIATNWTRAVRDQWEAAASPEAIAALMPLTCCLVHGSVMMRTSTLRACGGYNATLPVAQDYDLWLRLLPDARFARLPEALYTFRVHSRQISANKGRDQSRQSVAAKLRYVSRIAMASGARTATILGSGAGVDLYRSAINDAGWIESPRDGDVTIFTDFSTLDRDMRSAIAQSSREMARIGNFLIASGAQA